MASSHTHKYLRVPIKGRDSVGRHLYRCVRAGCTHYIREEFIVGQKCICWRCDDEFIIEQKQKKLKKLHCRNCTKRRNIVDAPVPNIQESPL
jgi:hypothetical protein